MSSILAPVRCGSLIQDEGQVADVFGHSFTSKIETLSITSGSDAIAAFECSAKYICALKADRSRHALDDQALLRQALTELPIRVSRGFDSARGGRALV